jgi:hypothetical protein
VWVGDFGGFYSFVSTFLGLFFLACRYKENIFGLNIPAIDLLVMYARAKFISGSLDDVYGCY